MLQRHDDGHEPIQLSHRFSLLEQVHYNKQMVTAYVSPLMLNICYNAGIHSEDYPDEEDQDHDQLQDDLHHDTGE